MDVMWSVPSLMFLSLAVSNFLFSLVLVAAGLYRRLQHQSDEYTVYQPSEKLYLGYSVAITLPTGLCSLAILTIALFYKAAHALCFLLCPVTQSRLKKRMAGFKSQSDFSQYENEFNFEVDFNS